MCYHKMHKLDWIQWFNHMKIQLMDWIYYKMVNQKIMNLLRMEQVSLKEKKKYNMMNQYR